MTLAALTAVGCKPQAAPSAPAPTPGRAPAVEAVPPSPAGELPAGHPPLSDAAARKGTEATTDTPALPPGHPPMNAAPGAAGAVPDPSQLPPGHPPMSAAPGAAGGMGGMPPMPGGNVPPASTPGKLIGVTLTTPEGWQPGDAASSGPLGPVLVYRLPRVEGDAEDVDLRVTHFPTMRNIPREANLERWYSAFKQPDGKATKDVALVEVIPLEGITAVVVDVPGTLVSGQGGPEKPNYRMVAAILEHPQGPHFVKAIGPAASVEKWRSSILDYLRSAKVAP